MTKTWVFGEVEEKKGKPIEICSFLSFDGEFDEVCDGVVNACDHIVLIKRSPSYDVMYAYSESDPTGGDLYLGHWNSGRYNVK